MAPLGGFTIVGGFQYEDKNYEGTPRAGMHLQVFLSLLCHPGEIASKNVYAKLGHLNGCPFRHDLISSDNTCAQIGDRFIDRRMDDL